MKRLLFFVALAGLLLAGCGGQDEAVFASYAPSGYPYEKVEIQVSGREQFAETGTLSVSTTFTARDGRVLTIAMKRLGDELIFAQDLPGSGVKENDSVSDSALRTVLLDEGITNAGQFKLSTAKTTIDLIFAFTDPALRDAVVPAQFQLLDTNLAVEK